MKKAILATLLIAATASTAGAQSVRGLELGLTAGYASGLSGEIFLHKANLVGPFGVKVSAAYTRPSDSFVDSADFGGGVTIDSLKKLGMTESGSHIVLGADGTYNLGEVAPGVGVLGYAGLRYGMFSASLNAPSNTGTTSTTISSNAFGIGAGAQVSYALAGNISLVGDLGVDHFFNSTLNYSDGTNKDSITTGDAAYNNTRNAVAFPGTAFKAKIGVKYTF